MFSLLTVATINAAPVRFEQVVQVVNAKPGKANSGNFARLRLTSDGIVFDTNDNDGDNDEKKKTPAPQDNRVITETTSEIIEDEVCDCEDEVVKKGFPKWALLGLGAIPLFFIFRNDKDPTPTPSMTPPITQTPTKHRPLHRLRPNLCLSR